VNDAKIAALTLKQFRYLVALADTGHFGKAAERCGISQPSLSAQLQNLELALATRLVERDRSGVTFTPTGREVTERARRVLLEVQGVVDFTSTAQHGLAGTIRLGVKPTLGPYLLPKVVAALHRQHPELKLYIREGAPYELEAELSRGVHDMIVAQLPVRSSSLVSERLFREPILLAVSAEHPVAALAEVTAVDLEGLPVLSLARDYHLHDQVGALCRDVGATLVRDYEGTSLDALRQMVAMNMGATFLPALYVHSEIRDSEDVVVRKLEEKAVSRSIGAVWRKGAGRVNAYSQIAAVIRSVVADELPVVSRES